MSPTFKAPNRILVDAERVRHWDNPNGVMVDADLVTGRSSVDVEYVRARRFAKAVTARTLADEKLDFLLKQGWEVSGVSISRREDDGSYRHGFVTEGGFVGWYKP